jgi:uncharacterized protein (TIGR03086 family)
VRDLLQHVIAGNKLAVVMLESTSRDAVNQARSEITSTDQVGNDPAAAFASTADAMVSAFARPGALEWTCHHVIGDVPGVQLLGFRIGDLTLHAWDLARALGVDETLDLDVAEFVLASLMPLAPTIGQTGLFGTGPSGSLAPDAPVQERLLDLAGRRA